MLQRPVPWWLRAYLLIAMVQGMLVMGTSGLFFPADIFIPIEVSPLNARFIGGLYMAGGIGVLLSALARSVDETRIFVIGFGLIATIATIVTFAYWDEFTAEGIPWIWTLTYILDAAIALVLFVMLGLWRFIRPGRHRLTPLFAAQAVVMGLAGLVLLFAPRTAIEHWPWGMTVILSRLYGTFFLTFAVGAAIAAWETWMPANRIFVISSFLLKLLSMAAALPHLERFTSTQAKVIWFGGFGIGALLMAIPLAVLWAAPQTAARGQAHVGNP